MPTVLFVAVSILFLLGSGKADVGLFSIGMLMLMALEVPCMALFLTAFATNKVEGLALSIACGLLFAGPVVAALVPQPWGLLAA